MWVNDEHCYDIVFLALAQNCAATLPGMIRALDNLRNSQIKIHAVVGENGSHDETRELLESAAASTGMISVVDTSLMSRASGRLERMALGRQFLAEHAKDMLTPARAICVLDVDEPFLEHLDPVILLSELQRMEDDDDIFAVSATSRPTYYDLLAYEGEDHSFTDLDKRIQRLRRNPLKYYSFFRNFIYPQQQRLTSDSDIHCRSAFNGLCLYQADIYAVGSYMPHSKDSWICEHVTFNRSLARATGGRMVISGALVLPMPSEHGRRTLSGFVLQRMRKLRQLVVTRFGLNG